MENRNLLEQLDQFRLERRITQEQLANILGVAFVTVNRWFNGHTMPSKIQKYHIAKLLKSKGRSK